MSILRLSRIFPFLDWFRDYSANHFRLDLIGGLIKSLIFGGIIAMSGIYFGFNTEGGAEGVGQSVMKSVVGSCLSILVADYLLAIILFQIIFRGS